MERGRTGGREGGRGEGMRMGEEEGDVCVLVCTKARLRTRCGCDYSSVNTAPLGCKLDET